MGLNLGNSADFARATLSSVSGLAQAFGRDSSQWDILEGAYNNVLFHVFQSKVDWSGALGQISDTGGRRKVKYMFPYVDGQTTDDLGRKPETFAMEIVIHGPSYLKGLKALLKEFDKPTPGDLIHPIRGQIRCVPEEWTLTHKSEERQAVTVHVTFIEHNFTIGEIRDTLDRSVNGALSKALDTFKYIENAINKVTGLVTFVNSLKVSIKQQLEDYNNRFGLSLTDLNSFFNVDGSTSIPSLLPVNDGGNRNSDGSLAGTNFSTAVSPSETFASVPVDSASSAAGLSVNQLQAEVVALRQQLNRTIGLMESGNGGLGALEMYDEIQGLKQTSLALQDVLEKGIASSRAKTISYTVPRLMTIREVAFANGISLDRVQEIQTLNPDLTSVNFIEKNSVLKVPTS